MIRFASLALLTSALFACGGAEDDDMFEDVQDGGLGTAEQAFRGKSTPSFQHGTRTATTAQKCDKVSTTQTCAVPPSKTLTYCVHGQNSIPGQGPAVFAAADRTRILAVIEGLDTLTDFTLNPTAASDCQTFPGQMNWFPGAVGTSGSAPTDIKEFARTQFGSLTSLTEGAGVVGNYQSWGSCKATIDIVDIKAKGTSSTQDNNGIDHAGAHTLLACIGIGGRSGAAGNASRNLFDLASPALDLTTGESCQILGFTLSDPGQFNLNPVSPCTVD